MATPVISSSFVSGECSPNLFGHVDLVKLHSSAATMRNMWVRATGGAYSRAGTAFCGYSKQTGRSYPPRLVTFQFSIQQGLALEFGNEYMRVLLNGAYVTNNPLMISAATNSNPLTVTINTTTALTVSPINTSVTASYKPTDQVTLAGGVFTLPAIVSVTDTKLLGTVALPLGTGYAPADTVTLAGGTPSTNAILTINTTQVVGATVVAPGSGGVDGPAVLTGTTGTGTKFEVAVVIQSGAIFSITGITLAGDYTVNPSNVAAEPVTGASLSGATLAINMAPLAVSITNPGVYTANPAGGVFTQASTSGGGTGAQFGSALMGINSAAFVTTGTYTTDPTNPVMQASTTGTGAGVEFTVSFGTGTSLPVGAWMFFEGVGGMTQLNGRTLVISNVAGSVYSFQDVFGNNVDSTGWGAFTSGGTAAQIFELATPWAEQDLKWLKWTESADTMSICCVNQDTQTDYPPYELERIADNDWNLTLFSTAETITPPSGLSTHATPNFVSGSTSYVPSSAFYRFFVTSVSQADGSESVASAIGAADSASAVDIAAIAGTVSVNWSAVAGAQYYNIYMCAPVVSASYSSPNPPPTGALAGFVGSSTGTGFNNSNIVPDFSQTPPTHQNPFPGTGQYPGLVAYFQERRAYANTLNAPDTYFMSQPGLFYNFDTRIPTIDSDAITGTPWGQQVNGIQWMLQVPGGLLVLTGLTAWLVGGQGSSSLNPQPIAPSDQQATTQASAGASAFVPPVRPTDGYDFIYLQAKNSIYRTASYQFFTNIFTGADITVTSSHLFLNYTIVDNAWCQEPYRLLWVVRSDGVMLTLTWLKEQEVSGWARHDTQGLFQSVCSVTEPPVDALYVCVQRFIGGVFGGNPAYMIERMDNRLWTDVETTWCVDCGLSLPLPQPSATLYIASATGLGSITGFSDLVGGQGYGPETTCAVVDNNGAGPGTGASVTLTISGGVITNLTITPGAGYTFPAFVFSDPSGQGSGASANPILNNSATFEADSPTFSMADIGNVIRAAGGVAIITGYTSNEIVTADITSPITGYLPNTPGFVPPQLQGSWSLSSPTSTVGGLFHLIGGTVTGIADGEVITPRVVDENGSITLDTPATAVTVGLGFTAQLQSVYLDAGSPTVQGQRKKIGAVTARIEASRQIQIGSNQADGSTLSPVQIAPIWQDMEPAPDLGIAPYIGGPQPLYTGDVRIAVGNDLSKPGQAAVQQVYPLPMQILALIPETLEGDTPSQGYQKKEQGQGRGRR